MPNIKNVRYYEIFDINERTIKTKIKINYNGKSVEGIALWDTGATTSCISKRVVDDLQLIPVGITDVCTASERLSAKTYIVDFELPTEELIKDVNAIGTGIDNQGIDVLIGMDIITMGELIIRSYNGATFFGFGMVE